MTYLWIALGGALGSMARAWLGALVARATGPAFPWGTIAINIIGSFVIGFFGTLTAADGRWSVPADARAFVMVGLCGGFTTFSSFSLQTLELARDGRVPQACANIGLSVGLCLASVAAGHFSAKGLDRPRTQAAAFPETDRIGSAVAAILNRPGEADTLLDAATLLLSATGGKRLKAVAIRMPAATALLASEEMLTAERKASLHAQQEGWLGDARTALEARRPDIEKLGWEANWLLSEGDPIAAIVAQGTSTEVFVMARPEPLDPEPVQQCLHAALFQTGRPLLLMPPNFHGRLAKRIAIAWKDDPMAAAAVRAALPLLRRAEQVHVLCAGNPAMPPALVEAGLAAELHELDETGDVGHALLEATRRLETDLLVMGACAHGGWRERLFGGATKTVLSEAQIPVFLRQI